MITRHWVAGDAKAGVQDLEEELGILILAVGSSYIDHIETMAT